MAQILRQISTEKFLEVPFDGDISKLDLKENYWLSIKEEDREKVLESLESFDYSDQCKELILNPDRSTRITIYGKDLLVDLKVSRASNIYDITYLTILLRKGIVVTITEEKSVLLEELESKDEVDFFSFNFELTHLVYFIISEVLQQGIDSVGLARKRVKILEDKLDREGGGMELSEIIKAQRDISRLTNIIEDQQNILSFFPKLDWEEHHSAFRQEYLQMVNGLVQIFNSAERLEEKLTGLRNQYQLLLQDKGNARLNALTILQSIFVPLSFLTGLYGMNFVNMPELGYKYGYYITLGVMISIIIGQLLWFRYRGWFD